MGVRVTTAEGITALYDSTSGVAFGPVFDTLEDADAFLTHLQQIGERDPRLIPVGELGELAREWQEERE